MIGLLLSHVLGNPLQTELETLLRDPALDGAVVSAYVCKADGSVIFDHNAATRVVPASNEKLVTSCFAMNQFGPDKRFKTLFWKEADGVTVYAGGDPSLTSADVKAVGEKLGIRSGTSIYVKQAFRVGVPDDWEFDDLPNKYAPKIMAWSVDKAAFTLESEKGQVIPPEAGYLVDVDRRPFEEGDRISYDPITGHCDVRGTLPEKKTVLDTLAQAEPDRSASTFLGSRRLVPIQNLPFRAPDQVIESKPLGDILKECLVMSDNYIAEQLFLIAGDPQAGKSPYAQSRTKIGEFLKSAGVPEGDFHTRDGSGMSRHNLVTTRGLAHLLRWVNKQPWAELYKNYLVTPGQGTLKERKGAASFRGKTGTLDMVVALSGYVKNAAGDEVIASVIFNHSTASSSKQRAVADAFMAALEKSR